jgi:hypothetical protein
MTLPGQQSSEDKSSFTADNDTTPDPTAAHCDTTQSLPGVRQQANRDHPEAGKVTYGYLLEPCDCRKRMKQDRG